MNQKLSPNMEMYLKTILRLEKDSSSVRVKAIADSLGVTMPSVSEALRNLKSRGLVEHSSYGEVKLSEDGRSVAAGVNETTFEAAPVSPVSTVLTGSTGSASCRGSEQPPANPSQSKQRVAPT